MYSDKRRIYEEGRKAGTKGNSVEDALRGSLPGSKDHLEGYRNGMEERSSYVGGSGAGPGSVQTLFGVIFLIVFVLILLSFLCGPKRKFTAAQYEDPRTRYDRLQQQADALILAGKYSEAIPLLDSSLQIYSRDVGSYTKRGTAYRGLKDYNRAMKEFNYAIALNPGYAEAYYERAFTQAELGKFEAAIADYTRIVNWHVAGDGTYWNRGYCYHELGRYREAIADYTQAARLRKPSARLFANRAAAYYNLREFQGAAEDIRAAIALDPNNSEYHTTLEEVMAAQNRSLSPIVTQEQQTSSYGQNRQIVAGAEEPAGTSMPIGTWAGTVMLSDPRYMNNVSIDLDTASAHVRYVNGCGGSLVLAGTRGGAYVFTEKLEYGDLRCINGGTVELRRAANNELDYKWFFPDGRIGAHGTLQITNR